MSGLVILVGLLVLVCIVLTCLLYFFQRRLYYLPYQGVQNGIEGPKAYGIRFDTVRIQTEDGVELSGWFMPQEDSIDHPTVIMFHGNAGNLVSRLPMLRLLHQLPCRPNLAIFSYRGYGLSGSTWPTEAGLMHDAMAIHSWALSEPQIASDRIFFLGKSLGGFVAFSQASSAEHPPAGLILENTFLSIDQMAIDLLGKTLGTWFRPLIIDHLSNEDIAHNWDSEIPVLMLSSQKDEIIHPRHMSKLHDILSSKSDYVKLIPIPGGDHNSAFIHGGHRYSAAVSEFISGRS